MPEPFELLGETLLRAGVAPVHVRRYLRELSEHFSDLVREEREAGRSPDEARAAAHARLGADEALTDAMLAEPCLRSWTARAPCATMVVGPILLLVLAWALTSLGFVFLFGWAPDGHGSRQPPVWLPHSWVAAIGTALLAMAQVGGPLLIAAGIALLGARQRSPLVWPLLGCLAVALLGASLVWGVQWPAVDPRDPLGRVSSAVIVGLRGAGSPLLRGGAFSLADWSRGLPLVALNLAVAGAVYRMARGRDLLRSP